MFISFARRILAWTVDSTSPGVIITLLPVWVEAIFIASSIPSRFPLKESSSIIFPPASIFWSLCSTCGIVVKAALISKILIPKLYATRITAVRFIALKLPNIGAKKSSVLPSIITENLIPSSVLEIIFRLFGNFVIFGYSFIGTLSCTKPICILGDFKISIFVLIILSKVLKYSICCSPTLPITQICGSKNIVISSISPVCLAPASAIYICVSFGKALFTSNTIPARVFTLLGVLYTLYLCFKIWYKKFLIDVFPKDAVIATVLNPLILLYLCFALFLNLIKNIFSKIALIIYVKIKGTKINLEMQLSSKAIQVPTIEKVTISKIAKNLLTRAVKTKGFDSFLFHKIKLIKYITK